MADKLIKDLIKIYQVELDTITNDAMTIFSDVNELNAFGHYYEETIRLNACISCLTGLLKAGYTKIM